MERKRSRSRVVALSIALGLAAATAAWPPPATADGFTASLRSRLDRFVRDRLEVPFESIDVPSLGDFALPDVDPDTIRVELTSRGSGQSASAMPVTVVLSSDTEVLKRGVVTVRVRAPRTLWVAARHLKKGHRLRESDLRAERRDARSVPRGATGNLASLVGLELERSVREGAVLRVDWLDEPSLVLRGQRVRLVAERGGLRIEGVGRAVSDGALGEQIRVVNLESRREVSGHAIASGLVRVDF